MSFDESRERDHALRVATVGNRYTPEDATRELILLLSHVIPVMVEGAYEQHRELGCDPCHRAVVWLPILDGQVSGREARVPEPATEICRYCGVTIARMNDSWIDANGFYNCRKGVGHLPTPRA